MRQIILDTETTGLEPKDGHRIIEIGCIELNNRTFTGNNFHVYLNPERYIEQEALTIHGITNDFLQDKPLFKDIVKDFLLYIQDAEILAHNASFDIGFLNHELNLAYKQSIIDKPFIIQNNLNVVDTLQIARQLHPGQRNNLDALCKRYKIDNSKREFHGALLDARLLSEVYLAMTGGQKVLGLFATEQDNFLHINQNNSYTQNKDTDTITNEINKTITQHQNIAKNLKIIFANEHESFLHQEYVDSLEKQAK